MLRGGLRKSQGNGTAVPAAPEAQGSAELYLQVCRPNGSLTYRAAPGLSSAIHFSKTLHLVRLQATVLLPPAVIRHLSHADRANGVGLNFCPCDTKTSTCRSFATISSGLCFFLGIAVLPNAKWHTSARTTSRGEDQWPKALSSLYRSNTLVLRTSGQFCLNVKPRIRIRAPSTRNRFRSMVLTMS